MNRQKKVIDYFKNGFNCSQSVLTVFGTDYGLSEDNCLKIACAFGGGMGRQQHVCGAVTGALMFLGLKYGKALHDDDNKKKDTYAKTVEFFNEFKKIHGSISCRELLDGLNMTDPEDYKKIEENRFFEIRCKKYVEDAVAIVEKMMT
jgi:C_GCAxxG_C_C family probable redox protein